MKKLLKVSVLLLAAVLMLGLAGCPPEKPVKLTIKNNSSYDLKNVSFSGIDFGDIPKSGGSVTKQLTESALGSPSRITFTRADIGIVCQTHESRTYFDKDNTWPINDNIEVVEVGNSGNKKNLGEIKFVLQVLVEYDGRNVKLNDDFNLGEAIIGTISPFDYTLKNNSSGILILKGNEPVKIITQSEAGVFSIVQPTSSEIAVNGSLPFKINVNPKDEQNYTATVMISSDAQNGYFEFNITARGVFAKIEFNANSVTAGMPPVMQLGGIGSVITIPGQNTLVRTGYYFVGWNTLADGTGTNYSPGDSYTVNGGINTLYAMWELVTYTLTTDINFADRGTISRNPDQSSYVPGTQVTVMATPDAGFKFLNWTGTGVSAETEANNSILTVTMNNDLTLTANFGEKKTVEAVFNESTPSWSLPEDVTYPVTVEIYALGAGGGGQGGNWWWNIFVGEGSGGAGGGGAAAYVEFDVPEPLDDFAIEVGSGGYGGSARDSGGSGHNGDNGGYTKVTWGNGNTFTVEGGYGGAGRIGGNGGYQISWPSIVLLEKKDVEGSRGGNGKENDSSRKKGGNAATLDNIGSFGSIQGGIGTSAGGETAIRGAGGSGGAAKGSGGRGGNGEVRIIATWYE